MPALNAIIAIEKGVKARVYGEITELNKVVQKPDLFNGFSKSYQKKDEDGDDLPSENKKVQLTAEQVLEQTRSGVTQLMRIEARKDYTNCVAKADVIIDENTLIKDAPVSYLLFLEKQLTDVRTFISNIPVLDPTESWTLDSNSGLYRTDEVKTHRTKKTVRPIVLLAPTPEHPGQAQLVTEDILAGFWNQVKMSGAMPAPRKKVLLERVENLLQGVKQARERANSAEETDSPDAGSAIFNYLLA